MAVFEHVVERGTAPVLGGVALGARHVFECVALVGFPVVPAKAASLIDRMQRVDEDQAARQMQAAVAAALAEAADQVALGKAGETLTDQPVHQVQAGSKFHTPLCRAIAPGESLTRPA